MNATGRCLQLLTGAAGFLTGYLWGVTRWARTWGGASEAFLLRSSLGWGVMLAVAYGLLAGVCFWPWIPAQAKLGVRIAVAPTAFTLSFVVGASGILASLWLMG